MVEVDNVALRNWLPQYLGLTLAWGTSFLLIENSLKILDPIEVNFLRSTIGALTLWIYSITSKLTIPNSKKIYIKLFILSLLLNTFPGLLFAYAQTEVSSTLAGIINAATPLLTTVLSVFIFKNESISRIQIIGLLIGFIGVITVIGFWNGLGENSLFPILALLGAVTCFAFSYPYIRIYIDPHGCNPVSMATIQLIFSSLTQLPFLSIRAMPLTMEVTISIAVLGILSTGLAYVWNFQLISRIGGQQTSTISYLIPIVAVLAGAFFAKESIGLREIFGGIIILLGLKLSRSVSNSSLK